jgi:tetratricopeptide (TPR) repeat protein
MTVSFVFATDGVAMRKCKLLIVLLGLLAVTMPLRTEEPESTAKPLQRGRGFLGEGDYAFPVVDAGFDLHDTDVKNYTEAIRRNPNSAEAFRKRGDEYLYLDKFFKGKQYCEKAMLDYYRAIQLDPNDAAARTGLGNAHASLGHFDRAFADFKDAIATRPKYADAYCSRGATYLTTGAYDKAIIDLGEAVRLNPKDGRAFFYRSQAYEKKGNKAKAAEDAAQAKKLGYSESKPESIGAFPQR